MYANIDLSDIPEIKGERKARKNPFYERIMKEGFTIQEYYSPEDIKNIKKGNLARRLDICTLDEEELAALQEYRKTSGVDVSFT
jgi:hypothetical protein